MENGESIDWYRKEIKAYQRYLEAMPKRDPRRNQVFATLHILRSELAVLRNNSASRETTQEVLNRFIPQAYGEW